MVIRRERSVVGKKRHHGRATELTDRIERHAGFYAAIEAAERAGDSDRLRSLCECESAALDALLAFPVRTLSDAQRKASYLLDPELELAGGLDGRHLTVLLRSFLAE